ncbi:hypothetical protein RCH20_002492 [Psychrobacter sp. PL15]|jgi:hypothetical protein|nr:hypothetical protein [Psychrobacter sp. PL15]
MTAAVSPTIKTQAAIARSIDLSIFIDYSSSRLSLINIVSPNG